MPISIALAVIGLLHILNGVWMLLAPMSWYMAVPGVIQTGPINHHFVADIALAFLASGTGLLIGARRNLAAYAVAGAVWPSFHALLHVWGWFSHGFPDAPQTVASEAVGVVLVGAIGALLAFMQARQQGVFR